MASTPRPCSAAICCQRTDAENYWRVESKDVHSKEAVIMQRIVQLVVISVILTALSLAIGPAGAQEAPQVPASGTCAPGAAYDPACDVDHDGDVDVLDIQLAAGHWNQAGTWTAGDYWSLTGNAGTTPGTHFVGTTDNQSLELRVAGQRALRLEPNATSPNLIGGHEENWMAAGVFGSVIAGGGNSSGSGNRVYSNFSTIGGGLGNRTGSNGVTSIGATIAGGSANEASASYATVGGGHRNTASASYATVGGGSLNTASGSYATVPGGWGASATHFSEQAYASGNFADPGDAQTSLYVLRRETGDDTLTELFLDGSFWRIILADNRVMTFDILVVASHRFGGGSSAGYQVAGVIRNIGGVTAFVGTPVKTVLGENVAGWDVQVEANDAVDALVVKVQGSNGTTIRWVASVRTVEVGR
jgi:hypothetical protein